MGGGALSGPLPFATAQDWSNWLAANHAATPEVWLKLYRKDSGLASINWEQAVIEALCWGWIDGLKRSGDETYWLQRFTPRRTGSGWSQKNCGHVERLIADGRMQAPGLARVLAAKADGRWDAAYAGSKAAQVPADFLAALAAGSAIARAGFAALNRQNLFAIYSRVTTAKRPETRAKRIADLVAMLERGEKLY